MARIVYRCEGPDCYSEVSGPEVHLCGKCQAKADGLRPCWLCGTMFDPSRFGGGDNVVCCGTRVQIAFYRGQPLSDSELEWMLAKQHVTAEQREVAVGLAKAGFRAGESSVSFMHEAPHIVCLETPDGLPVQVTFPDAYQGRTTNPVETIELGGNYEGVTAAQVWAVIVALTPIDPPGEG